MIAMPRENRAAVDALLDVAKKLGGTPDVNPTQDLGFMYNRSFTDIDGHIWEAFWMDMESFPGNSARSARSSSRVLSSASIDS